MTRAVTVVLVSCLHNIIQEEDTLRGFKDIKKTKEAGHEVLTVVSQHARGKARTPHPPPHPSWPTT